MSFWKLNIKVEYFSPWKPHQWRTFLWKLVNSVVESPSAWTSLFFKLDLLHLWNLNIPLKPNSNYANFYQRKFKSRNRKHQDHQDQDQDQEKCWPSLMACTWGIRPPLKRGFCASWFDQNIGGKEYWTQKRISGGGRHAISDLLDATASIPFV